MIIKLKNEPIVYIRGLMLHNIKIQKNKLLLYNGCTDENTDRQMLCEIYKNFG